MANTISTIAAGKVIKRNGTTYLTTNYLADKGYVSAVCIDNTDQRGQTYQLAIDEVELNDTPVQVANMSPLSWKVAEVDINFRNEDLPLMFKLDMDLLIDHEFHLPEHLQQKMNIVEEGEVSGVTFYGDHEQDFLNEVARIFPMLEGFTITDAYEGGAAIFAKSKEHCVEGFLEINFDD